MDGGGTGGHCACVYVSSRPQADADIFLYWGCEWQWHENDILGNFLCKIEYIWLHLLWPQKDYKITQVCDTCLQSWIQILNLHLRNSHLFIYGIILGSFQLRRLACSFYKLLSRAETVCQFRSTENSFNLINWSVNQKQHISAGSSLFAVSYIVLKWIFGVLDCWSDKTKHLKTSPWALRTGEGHFSVFWHFIDETINWKNNQHIHT